MIKNHLYKFSVIIMFITPISFALEINDSPVMYISNNTKQISIDKAYSRILNNNQSQLENSVIDILQKHDIQQGKFTTLLGIYKNYGDNTKQFTFSPYQHLSESNINNIAHEIAITLNQDSVLVFIPGACLATREINVELPKEKELKFKQVFKIIHKNLDSNYTQNFSMLLDNSYSGINKAAVTNIIWFGKNHDIAKLKKAFPNSKIKERCGSAYLIYQDGKQDI
ncbi:MAG: hypothetical protein PHC75_04175 [Burkholderiales bacterium]|nr:hypothetical protein [Burkholderiales bacterium]